MCVPSGDTYGCFPAARVGVQLGASSPHLCVSQKRVVEFLRRLLPLRRRRRGHGDGNRPAQRRRVLELVRHHHHVDGFAHDGVEEDEVGLDGSLGSAEDGGDAGGRAVVVEVADHHLVGFEDEDVHRGDGVEGVDGDAGDGSLLSAEGAGGDGADVGEGAVGERAWISERIAATMGPEPTPTRWPSRTRASTNATASARCAASEASEEASEGAPSEAEAETRRGRPRP